MSYAPLGTTEGKIIYIFKGKLMNLGPIIPGIGPILGSSQVCLCVYKLPGMEGGNHRIPYILKRMQ